MRNTRKRVHVFQCWNGQPRAILYDNLKWKVAVRGVICAAKIRMAARSPAQALLSATILSCSKELPFGRGKALSFNNSALCNRVLGGFVVNAIYTWQIGAPLSWGNVIYYGGDIHLNPRGVDGAFDKTRFNTISSQQLSNNIRTFPSRIGNLRQDGANNWDLSLIKNVAIIERVKFQLRIEAFNALNHPEFNSPDLSTTSSTFGKITSQPNLARNIQLGGRLVW
ncbi:MAG: hypothetical protein M3Y27_24775 [Acidobacteriota bacterium]|nr:hypothetical protein [Acidobacteriota bacterium]